MAKKKEKWRNEITFNIKLSAKAWNEELLEKPLYLPDNIWIINE